MSEELTDKWVPAFDVTIEGITKLRMGGPYLCRRCGKESLDFPGVCDPCAERIRLEDERRRLAPARESIPENFRAMRFGSKDLSHACRIPKRIEAAELAAASIVARREHLVLLHGPTATAKTSLACAILNRIIDTSLSLGGGSRFVFAPMVARAYIETQRGSTPGVVQSCYQASVLVIDDLGQDVVYRDALRTLIQNRDADRCPTIVTTFLTKEEAAECYGGGIARRLYIDALHIGTARDR